MAQLRQAFRTVLKLLHQDCCNLNMSGPPRCLSEHQLFNVS